MRSASPFLKGLSGISCVRRFFFERAFRPKSSGNSRCFVPPVHTQLRPRAKRASRELSDVGRRVLAASVQVEGMVKDHFSDAGKPDESTLKAIDQATEHMTGRR